MSQVPKDTTMLKESECGKRFDVLLKQTKFVCHLATLDSDTAKDSHSAKRRLENIEMNKATSSADILCPWNHLTEKEEDDILVEAALTSSNIIDQFEESPSYIIGGTLCDYQIHGLNWLINLHDHGINGILADEMGLGKKLQTIALIGYLKHYRKSCGPHMVIGPKSILSTWQKQFGQWCPSVRTVCFTEDQAASRYVASIRDTSSSEERDVFLTSLEMAINEKAALKTFNWQYIVIDDVHCSKNEKAKLFEVVQEFKSSHRLLLTRAPLQNNLHELWALLNFLLPNFFNSSEDFEAWIKMYISLGETSLVERLHAVLQPFFLRRVESEVENKLPPKFEKKIYIGLSKMQKERYTTILKKNEDILNGSVTVDDLTLLKVLVELKKSCNHPYLFEGIQPGPPFTADADLVLNSGKMKTLDKLLIKLKKVNSKVLIFSLMTRMLDILEHYASWRQFSYCRLDGKMSHEDQETAFNRPNNETFIFILHTRTGGLEKNFATVDLIVFFDSDWNPHIDLQAMNRAYCVGRTKPLQIYHFVSRNTMEEKIIEMAETLRADSTVLEHGKLVGQKKKKWDSEELLSILKYKNTDLMDENESEISDEDVDEILKNSEKKGLVEKFGTFSKRDAEENAVYFECDLFINPFSQEAINCLPEIPYVITDNDLSTRKDLRDLIIFSIDAETCIEKDDCLHGRVLENGNLEVAVHITDVSHFIKAGSVLDIETSKRAVKTVLGRQKEPMIPEELSRSVCSLNANKDSLVFSIFWELTESGEICHTDICKSVINSKASLTYSEAEKRFEDQSQNDEITVSLRLLNKLAIILKKRRLNEALLLPSVQAQFPRETGINEERIEMHLMVEEYMNFANTYVAQKIYGKFRNSALLRTYLPAENYASLIKAAESEGFTLNINSPEELALSLNAAVLPENPNFNKMLRGIAANSRPQGLYFASGNLEESEYAHCGLGLKIFTHFTSPIRRYADIIVHRQLAAAIGIDAEVQSLLVRDDVQDICNHLNYKTEKMNLYKTLSKMKTVNGYILSLDGEGLKILIPANNLVCSWHLYVPKNTDEDSIVFYDKEEDVNPSSEIVLKKFDPVLLKLFGNVRNRPNTILKLVKSLAYF